MFRLAVLIFMCQVGASLISFSSTTPAFACTRPPAVAFAQDRCSASGTRGIEKSAFSVVDTSFQGFQTSGYYPSNHSCSDGDIRIISMVVFMWKFERQESCSLSHMYSTLVDWHSSFQSAKACARHPISPRTQLSHTIPRRGQQWVGLAMDGRKISGSKRQGSSLQGVVQARIGRQSQRQAQGEREKRAASNAAPLGLRVSSLGSWPHHRQFPAEGQRFSAQKDAAGNAAEAKLKAMYALLEKHPDGLHPDTQKVQEAKIQGHPISPQAGQCFGQSQKRVTKCQRSQAQLACIIMAFIFGRTGCQVGGLFAAASTTESLTLREGQHSQSGPRCCQYQPCCFEVAIAEIERGRRRIERIQRCCQLQCRENHRELATSRAEFADAQRQCRRVPNAKGRKPHRLLLQL